MVLILCSCTSLPGHRQVLTEFKRPQLLCGFLPKGVCYQLWCLSAVWLFSCKTCNLCAFAPSCLHPYNGDYESKKCSNTFKCTGSARRGWSSLRRVILTKVPHPYVPGLVLGSPLPELLGGHRAQHEGCCLQSLRASGPHRFCCLSVKRSNNGGDLRG